MLAQGRSSSETRGGLAAVSSVSSGLSFLKKKKGKVLSHGASPGHSITKFNPSTPPKTLIFYIPSLIYVSPSHLSLSNLPCMFSYLSYLLSVSPTQI